MVVSTVARYFYPGYFSLQGVVSDPSGNLFVTTSDNTTREISAGGSISVVAGHWLGTGYGSYVNGPGPLAGFNQPTGVAEDNAGNLYIGDSGNSVIRKIIRAGQNWSVSTLPSSLEKA